MKNIILSSLLIIFSFALFAQGGTQLGISGLHQTKKIAIFDVSSATIQGNSCLITKKVDRHSNKIENATQTGKVFSKIFLKLPDIPGEYSKEFTTCYISGYSLSSQGNNAKETFTIHFNSLTERD